MESAEKTTNRSDAVERLHEQLQDPLQELVTSEDWQRALAVAAHFHDYSFANTRLIWAQSLARGFTPSRVAGYRAWQEGWDWRVLDRATDTLVTLLGTRRLGALSGRAERRVGIDNEMALP
ncbi:MAG: ArdC family protein [Acidimicrobiia bacterium]